MSSSLRNRITEIEQRRSYLMPMLRINGYWRITHKNIDGELVHTTGTITHIEVRYYRNGNTKILYYVTELRGARSITHHIYEDNIEDVREPQGV